MIEIPFFNFAIAHKIQKKSIFLKKFGITSNR